MKRSTSLVTMSPVFLLAFLAVVAVAFFSNNYAAIAEDDLGDYRFTSTFLNIGEGAVYGVIDAEDIPLHKNYHFFQALRGVEYTIVMDQLTVENADVAIINSLSRGNDTSPGQVLSVTGGRKTVTWTARTTDIYYLEVSGGFNFSDSSYYLGNYTLSGFEDTRFLDRHSDVLNGATPITTGNLYQGAISPWTNQPDLANTVNGGDDYDTFSFEAQRGVEYTVGVELGTSEGVEIAIRSFNGNGNGLEETNDGIGNTLSWIAPSNSVYYVALSGTDQVPSSNGTYTLKVDSDTTLQDLHVESVDGATAISFGNAHQGSISPVDDQDYFSFTAVRGARYILESSLGSAEGVELSVLDTAETVLETNGGVGTVIEWTAPSNGPYLAVVSGSSQVPNAIGTYSLNMIRDTTLQDRHGETAESASPLIISYPLPGAISPKSDQDYFSFLAERGVNYSVALNLNTADGAVISIENAAGERLSTTNGLGTGLGWTADSTGVFYIAVSHSPQATKGIGSYSVTLEANTSLEDRHLDTASSGTPVSFGTVYQGAISPELELDYFSFPAQRGVEYTIDLTYGSVAAASLEVIGDVTGEVTGTVDGSKTFARNFGADNIVHWTAPDSATYYVKVSASPRAVDPTGTYSLKITPDAALQDRHEDLAANATDIGFGNAISGAISPPDDYDYFRFRAEKGISYTVDVTLDTSEGVRFSLENQSAGFAASNFGLEQSLEWEAPETGWYTLAVSASGRVQNPVGTYHITIIQEGDARPPTPRVVIPDTTGLRVESLMSPTGSIVRVPVNLYMAEGVNSLGFTLNYDPNGLELIGVDRGSRLTEETFSYDADTPGQVEFGFASTKGRGPSGTAAVVTFRVTAIDGAVIPITLSDALMTNPADGLLNIGLVSADIKVSNRVMGDGNGDGSVTAFDALLAMKMASNILETDLSLDINDDGKVTVEDARSILNLARLS
ncbi:MAG: cohesin domain-containing protein [Chloroflexi bacterium]|nr:cohesin domain-containing protein [Chloroflexota bacterium]